MGENDYDNGDGHKNEMIGFEDAQLADGFAANFNFKDNNNLVRIAGNNAEMA